MSDDSVLFANESAVSRTTGSPSIRLNQIASSSELAKAI
jgi:hypothetical protein